VCCHTIYHFLSLPFQTQDTPVPQILPTIDPVLDSYPPDCPLDFNRTAPSRTPYRPAFCFSFFVIFLVDACVGLNWLLAGFFYHTLNKSNHSFIHSFIHSFKFFTSVLRSEAMVPQSTKWGYHGVPLVLNKLIMPIIFSTFQRKGM